MSLNTTRIKNIKRENVVIVFAVAGEKQFNLNCQFVPDEINVFATLAEVNQPNKCYQVISNLLDSPFLCICNGTNSLNPVFRYWNAGRKSIDGSYTCLVSDVSTGTQNSACTITLHFEFVRYEN